MATISQQLLCYNRRQRTLNFYETSEFQVIKNEFFKSETLAVLLEGMSGSGKSEIALTLALKYEHKLKSDANSNYIIVMVNSSSEDLLRNDLQNLCVDLKLNTLEMSTASCFKKIYEALNKEPYAGTKKLFLFDGMDLKKSNTESMLDSTVLICLRFLVNGDSRHKGNWKFIVTTEHEYEEDLSRLKPAAKIFKIEGFSEQDTLEFFKGSQLDDDNLKELHILMGGSPLGLSIAKKELRGRVQYAEEYIKRVEEDAEQYLTGQQQVEAKHKNVITAIAESLRPSIKKRGKDKNSDLLRCILFFNENNITKQLLLSCMEIINPKAEARNLADDVSKFCFNMQNLFLATEVENDERSSLTLHQLAMKALRLLVRHDDPIEVQQIDCRLALTALCRCMDFDGKFCSENYSMVTSPHFNINLNLSPHALSVVQFLKEKIDHQPTFCDVTIKTLYAKLLCAISYADIESRGGVVKGQRRLEEARDSMCTLVCGQDFTTLKTTARQDTETVDIPQKVGERLYSGCKQLMPDTAYKEYVGNVSLYQRLTRLNLYILGLKRDVLRNDHLDKRVLAELREHGKALRPNVMEKIFAAEFTASIFYLLSRLHTISYLIYAATENNYADLQQNSIEYAQIATAIYDKIKTEHGVTILYKVIVHREELMALLANQSQSHESHKILKEFEELSRLKGEVYTNGLLRSNLEFDNYHKLMCDIGMMRTHGCLYVVGDERSYDEGKRLFERCKEYYYQKGRNGSCPSILYQHYAEFLHNCERNEEAVEMLELAKKSLREADIPHSEFLELRFTKIHIMMDEYRARLSTAVDKDRASTTAATAAQHFCSICKAKGKMNVETKPAVSFCLTCDNKPLCLFHQRIHEEDSKVISLATKQHEISPVPDYNIQVTDSGEKFVAQSSETEDQHEERKSLGSMAGRAYNQECGCCLKEGSEMIDPRKLPCSHQFCYSCLLDNLFLRESDEAKGFPCPTCRSKCDLFVLAPYLPKVVEEDCTSKHGEVEHFCKSCDQAKIAAVSFCQTCDNRPLCQFHQRVHKENLPSLCTILPVSDKNTGTCNASVPTRNLAIDTKQHSYRDSGEKSRAESPDNEDYYKDEEREFLSRCLSQRFSLREYRDDKKIFIYHEDIISDAQKIQIEQFFKDKELECSFIEGLPQSFRTAADKWQPHHLVFSVKEMNERKTKEEWKIVAHGSAGTPFVLADGGKCRLYTASCAHIMRYKCMDKGRGFVNASMPNKQLKGFLIEGMTHKLKQHQMEEKNIRLHIFDYITNEKRNIQEVETFFAHYQTAAFVFGRNKQHWTIDFFIGSYDEVRSHDREKLESACVIKLPDGENVQVREVLPIREWGDVDALRKNRDCHLFFGPANMMKGKLSQQNQELIDVDEYSKLDIICPKEATIPAVFEGPILKGHSGGMVYITAVDEKGNVMKNVLDILGTVIGVTYLRDSGRPLDNNQEPEIVHIQPLYPAFQFMKTENRKKEVSSEEFLTPFMFLEKKSNFFKG